MGNENMDSPKSINVVYRIGPIFSIDPLAMFLLRE